jgi:hypothetical protein
VASKETISESRIGRLGWLGLAAGIVIFDLKSPDSLSASAHRGLEHPIGKYLIPAAIGATALHLLNLVPREYDIFYAREHIQTYLEQQLDGELYIGARGVSG